jgi:hypothetical protein
MQIVYTEHARRRIGKLGASAITGFLEEIPSPLRSKVLAGLPRPHGFRKGSSFEVKERAKVFAQAISHVVDNRYKEHDIYWKAFTVAWLCWAKNFFSVELDKFEGNTQRELAEFVIDKVGELRCAREDLEKLALFSYLSDDEASSNFISSRPGRDEIKSRRLVAELPLQVENIGRRVDEMLARISKIEKTQQSSIEEELLVNAVTPIEERVDSVRKASEEALETIRSRIDVSDGREIELRERVEALEVGAARLSTSTIAIEKALVEMGRESPSLRSAIEEELQRTNSLDIRLTALELTKTASVEAATLTTSAITRPFWAGAIRRVNPVNNGQIRPLNSIAEVTQQLSANFFSVGIVKSDAEAIARIVTAALVAGQLCTFAGSLADLLADAVHTGLFGTGYIECEIPLGLCDGELASACCDAIANEATGPALVLRGANRSAFEVYGGVIRESILRRQMGRGDPFEYRAMFATTCQGPSALDASESMTELGPTIDSDLLSWEMPRWGKVRVGALKGPSWRELFKQPDDVQEVWETTQSILGQNRVLSTSLLPIISRAYTSLCLIPNLDDSVCIELLLSAWLVPALVRGGADYDVVQKEVSRILKDSAPKLEILAAVIESADED